MGGVIPDGGDVERLHSRQPVRRIWCDVRRAAVSIREIPAVLRIGDGEIPTDIRRGGTSVGLGGVRQEIGPHLGHGERRLCRPGFGEIPTHGLSARGRALRRSECGAATATREDHEAPRGVLRSGGADTGARRTVAVATVRGGVGRRMGVDALALAVLRDRPLVLRRGSALGNRIVDVRFVSRCEQGKTGGCVPGAIRRIIHAAVHLPRQLPGAGETEGDAVPAVGRRDEILCHEVERRLGIRRTEEGRGRRLGRGRSGAKPCDAGDHTRASPAAPTSPLMESFLNTKCLSERAPPVTGGGRTREDRCRRCSRQSNSERLRQPSCKYGWKPAFDCVGSPATNSFSQPVIGSPASPR
jgi:hypothetical protein